MSSPSCVVSLTHQPLGTRVSKGWWLPSGRLAGELCQPKPVHVLTLPGASVPCGPCLQ